MSVGSESHFGIPKLLFGHRQASLSTHCLWLLLYYSRGQSGVAMTEIIWSPKQRIFIICPFMEKV